MPIFALPIAIFIRLVEPENNNDANERLQPKSLSFSNSPTASIFEHLRFRISCIFQNTEKWPLNLWAFASVWLGWSSSNFATPVFDKAILTTNQDHHAVQGRVWQGFSCQVDCPPTQLEHDSSSTVPVREYVTDTFGWSLAI